MAKVNYGTIVNDARGKVNGTVFSKNKFGAYTRRKVTPANPNTSAQSFARGNFASLSKAWSGTLTDAERASWVSYAQTYPRIDVFGASITLTGANMFLSLNQVLKQVGQAPVSNAPLSNVVTPIAFDPTSLAAVAATPILSFQETAASPGPGFQFYIFGEAPQPPGRTPQTSKMRFLTSVAGVTGPYPAAVDVTAVYRAKFGPWVAGQRISVLVATVDIGTGLTTVGTIMTCIST